MNQTHLTVASGTTVAGVPAVPSAFVYAVGHIEPRFPSMDVEKEFAQAVGRADSAGLTDREALHSVLADRSNRYLARQLCWVFTAAGLETYLLFPRDPADFDLLAEAARPAPADAIDIVIGERGPLADPQMCNGLVLPLVAFDQVYSFERGDLVQAIPRPDDVPEEDDASFRSAATELFDQVMQLADNAGATDEHRAVNYLAVRYPAIYARAAEAFRGNSSLSAVEARPSRLAAARRVIDVIFSYTHRQTDVTQKYFVRVDVTGKFPFLVGRLSPFFER